jgi:CysZ protein
MIIQSTARALSRLPTPQYRAVLWKTLGLAALALVVLWFALKSAFDWMALPWIDAFLPDAAAWSDWVSLGAGLLAGLALAIGLAFLIAPVTAVIAGFFIDDVAELVERADYPEDPPGRALPIAEAALQSAKFLGLVLVGNLVALLLLLVPLVNVAAFFVVNGYLIGREYFEFAAMRLMPQAEARALRRRHAARVFAGGLVIAAFLAVPILNLATPLFAATMMVHLAKGLARSRPTQS